MLIALEYIHGNNVIHRDIKPENLLFDDNGYIHISDFGIAKYNSTINNAFNSNNNNNCVHRETSGTVGYLAPEVLCAQYHSFSVDFFAIGVIAFELMFGRRPYCGNTRKEYKQNILSHQVIIKDKQIPQGWSKTSAEFINELIQRKTEIRLGCNGVKEVMHHSWFSDFDWSEVKSKHAQSPFELECVDNNFNKKYCECEDKVGEETKERYKRYVNNVEYATMFRNYTCSCIPREEIHNYYKMKINSNNANVFKRSIVLPSDYYNYNNNNNNKKRMLCLNNVVSPKKHIQCLNDVTSYYQTLKYNNNNNNNYNGSNKNLYNVYSSSSSNSDLNGVNKDKGGKLQVVQENINKQGCLLPFGKYVFDKPFGSRGMAVFQDKMKRVYHLSNSNSSSNYNSVVNNSNSNLPFLQKSNSVSNRNSKSNIKSSIHKYTLRKNNSVALFNQTHKNILYKGIAKHNYKSNSNINLNNSLSMYNSYYN